jgi:hypothetical protein
LVFFIDPSSCWAATKTPSAPLDGGAFAHFCFQQEGSDHEVRETAKPLPAVFILLFVKLEKTVLENRPGGGNPAHGECAPSFAKKPR